MSIYTGGMMRNWKITKEEFKFAMRTRFFVGVLCGETPAGRKNFSFKKRRSIEASLEIK
ncbi:MAG: hypothetical protein V1732_03010 [Patescibacteria group bacterium]